MTVIGLHTVAPGRQRSALSGTESDPQGMRRTRGCITRRDRCARGDLCRGTVPCCLDSRVGSEPYPDPETAPCRGRIDRCRTAVLDPAGETGPTSLNRLRGRYNTISTISVGPCSRWDVLGAEWRQFKRPRRHPLRRSGALAESLVQVHPARTVSCTSSSPDPRDRVEAALGGPTPLACSLRTAGSRSCRRPDTAQFVTRFRAIGSDARPCRTPAIAAGCPFGSDGRVVRRVPCWRSLRPPTATLCRTQRWRSTRGGSQVSPMLRAQRGS